MRRRRRSQLTQAIRRPRIPSTDRVISTEIKLLRSLIIESLLIWVLKHLPKIRTWRKTMLSSFSTRHAVMVLPNELRSSKSPGEESAPFITGAGNTSDLEQESLFLPPRQAQQWRRFGYLSFHVALILLYTVFFVVFTFRKRECGAPSLRDLSLYCMSNKLSVPFEVLRQVD